MFRRHARIANRARAIIVALVLLCAMLLLTRMIIFDLEPSFTGPEDYHADLKDERGSPAAMKALFGSHSRAEILLKKLAAGSADTISITFPDGSAIRGTKDGRIELRYSRDGGAVWLSDHADFSRLLDGASRNGGFRSYGNIRKAGTLEEFLDENVRAYYDRFSGGNHRAANIRGGGQFRYQRIRQVLAAPSEPHMVDRTSQVRGFECFFSSMCHVYKSIGLIVPDYTREEIENRYTSIFDDRLMGRYRRAATERDYIIPRRLIPLIRGKASSDPASTMENILHIAMGLRATNWAKLTGMSGAEFRILIEPDVYKARSMVERGYVPQVGLIEGFRWHYVAPVDIHSMETKTIVIMDDSWFDKKTLVYTRKNFTDFRFIIARGVDSAAPPGQAADGAVTGSDPAMAPLRVSRDYVPFINIYWLPTDSRFLNFNTHLITDVAPLGMLGAIESLDLSNNPLEEIGPLSRLEKMKDLNLRRTLVKDLAPLKGLPGLEVLNIRHTPVEDLAPLPKSLKKIYLDSSIQEGVIQKFRKSRPGCEIHYCDAYIDTNRRKGPLDQRWLKTTRGLDPETMH